MKRSTGRLANDAWESLLTAHARLMKRFAGEDVWQGMSMREYDVLYTLSKCPASGRRGSGDEQAVRMSELHRNLLLSQPAMSRMVDRLVDRGLIARVTDPSDRRGVLLSLTADGRTMQRRIGGGHAVGVSRAVNERLTSAEQQELERLCRKLAGLDSAVDDEHRDEASPEEPERSGTKINSKINKYSRPSESKEVAV